MRTEGSRRSSTWLAVAAAAAVLGGSLAGVVSAQASAPARASGGRSAPPHVPASVAPAAAPASTALDPPGDAVHLVTPAPLLGLGSGTGREGRRLRANLTVQVGVAGRAGVPASGAVAVLVELTAVDPPVSGVLTAFPSEGRRPAGGQLVFARGRVTSTLALVRLGAGGAIDLRASTGPVDVAADLIGYLAPGAGDRFTGLAAPATLGSGWIGAGTPGVSPRSPRLLTLAVGGRDGVPTHGVVAALVRLTAADARGIGSAGGMPVPGGPAGGPALSFAPGRTATDLAVLPSGAHGTVGISISGGPVDLRTDLIGWLAPGGGDGMVDLAAPLAIAGPGAGTARAREPLRSGRTLTVRVAGTGGVPAAGAVAALVNLVAIDPTHSATVAAFPSGGTPPGQGTLPVSPGPGAGTLALVPLGSQGAIDLTTSAGPLEVGAVVTGYLVGASTLPLTIATRSLAGAAVGVPYRAALVAVGGDPPYDWSVEAGTLPHGLSLAPRRGLITGRPAAPDIAPLTVMVSDQRGARASALLTLVVGPTRMRPGLHRGLLAVTVGQLPAGLPAAVSITGPRGYVRTVAATSVLTVGPGTYRVAARPVAGSADTFYPTVTGSPVRVTSGTSAVVGVSYLTAVANTTKVVPAGQLGDLRSVTPSESSFVFAPVPPSLASVQPGDVIAAGPSALAPGGFLERVTSMADANGELVLGTTRATLAEAVPRGAFSVQWPTSPITGSQATRLLARSAPTVSGGARPAPGVHPRGAPSPTVGGVPNDFIPSLSCGSNIGAAAPTIALSNVQFSITPHFDASWSWTQGLTADAYVEVVEGIHASLAFPKGSYCQDTIKLWGPQTIGIPDVNFSIGPVPVNISFLLEIDLTVKVAATANVAMTEQQGFTLDAGASYANGQLSPINSYTPNNNFQPPAPGSAGYLKVSVGPKFTFAFWCYDICYSTSIGGVSVPAITPMIGPTVGMDFFLELTLQEPPSYPSWALTGGLEFNVGFVANLWGIINVNAQLSVPIFSATLAAAPPVITTPPLLGALESGTLASPLSIPLQAGGCCTSSSAAISVPVAALQWNLVGTQPSTPGISLSQSGTLTVTGTPASFSGDISVDVSVTDALGQTTDGTFTIPVIPGPQAQTYDLPDAEVNNGYYYDLTPSMDQNQGGTPPYQCWGYTQGTVYIPWGYNIGEQATGCVVSGNPTTQGTMPFSFTDWQSVQSTVEDSFNPPSTAVDTLVIGPLRPAPVVTMPSGPLTGEVGVPFSFEPTASGGEPPYSPWDAYAPSASGGAIATPLPPGLTLDQNTGVVSGVPTTPGLYDVWLRVRDNLEGAAYGDVAVYVQSAPVITTYYVGDATVGEPYVAPLSAAGGTAPYGWEVTSVTDAAGAAVPMPAGLSLDPNTGQLEGTPLPGTDGTYTVQVGLTDQAQAQASRSLSLTILPQLVITSPAQLPAAAPGTSYSTSLTATGGSGVSNYNWTLGSCSGAPS